MNIQDELMKIHHKFGVSEMANYKIEQLIEDLVKKDREEQLRLGGVSKSVVCCTQCGNERLESNGVAKSLKESKPKTFELWMKNKGYRQNSKKQWLKHVYVMDARTLNNFKLEYENL